MNNFWFFEKNSERTIKINKHKFYKNINGSQCLLYLSNGRFETNFEKSPQIGEELCWEYLLMQ